MIWSTRFNCSFASSKYSFVAMDYFRCGVDELLCFLSEFLDLPERDCGGFVIFMADDKLAIFAEFDWTFSVEKNEFLNLEHGFWDGFVNSMCGYRFDLEHVEFALKVIMKRWDALEKTVIMKN